MTENYSWEAEKEDGSIITVGGDLTDCVRFSFLPNVNNLQRHDIIGIKLKRRFTRCFMRIIGNGKKNKRLHCIVAEGFRIYLNDDTGTILTTPEDYELYL